MLPIEPTITIAFLGLSLAVITAMVALENRKKTEFRPSLLPTTPIMLLSGTIALLALVHLLNLYGVHTGR